MCLAYRVQHKNSNPLGSTSFFVPCGKCEECRSAIKNAWGFRLRAEIEHKLKHDYKCVFFTLTYSDEKLPRLGWECFSNEYLRSFQAAISAVGTDRELKSDFEFIEQTKKLTLLPCFSRDHIETFVKDVKNWLYRSYDIVDISYFGAAEFGSHTKRPHYHFLMILPPVIDFIELHRQIKLHWRGFGHVFPRYFEGGIDSHGYYHKPFVVKSAMSAARYCAKYATKDLYYSEFLVNNGLTDKIINPRSRIFKRKMVFHVQKKSLGACILQDLSNENKLKLYTIGHAFIGDDKLTPTPVYVKNKLVFDNSYIWEPHTLMPSTLKGYKELGVIALRENYTYKRLVRRKANDFFCNNSKQIYDYKLHTYMEFFKQFCDSQRFIARGISPEFIRDAQDLMNWLCSETSIEEMAKKYLLYDGVPLKNWRFCEKGDEHLLYLARFLSEPNYDDFPAYNSEYTIMILNALDMVIQCFYLNPLSITEAKRLQDRIADFFKSLQTN